MNSHELKPSLLRKRILFGGLILFLLAAVMTIGQIFDYGMKRGGSQFREGGYDRGGVPEWDDDNELPNDKFTFARIMYSNSSSGWGRGGRSWRTDFPDADLNFSFRLEQLTAIKTDKDGVTISLTDPALFNYPFVFMSDPRSIELSGEEIKNLRTYLLNGGFLMVDDFWGDEMWNHFQSVMKEVFPDREYRQLTFEHEIFRAVFPLEKIPQVPSHDAAERGRVGGYTYEDTINAHPSELNTPNFRAWFDDDDRMMIIACHNNDLADGWEEEAYKVWFFREFSEKYSYPMGINILFYAMTH
ncbi:MAG TPA: DUF4159 domain-containing protein [Verrucomicrobiales bacterium]|jgi:hypothetical protein|nr:DUF4159 domain-containing protein [Verrucomicrobiales bacterium]